MSNNIASLELRITSNSRGAKDDVNGLNAAINKLIGSFNKATPAMKETSSAGFALSNSINKVNTSVNTLASSADVAAASSKKIADALKDVGRSSRGASSEVNKLEKDLQKLSSGGQALERLGGILSLGITAPLVALGHASIEAAMDMESITRSLNAVTGSATETSAQLKRLEELGKLPGLTFEQAAKGSSRLQAVGFSAQLSEKAIREMGNAISLSGGRADDLDGIVRALGQIEGKGELRAQELNQLAERIPTIRKVMKEAFGTANTEEIQAMDLSVQEFMQRMVKGFETLPRVVRGMRDEVDDARTSVKFSMAEIGNAVWPIAKVVMKDLATGVSNASKWFKDLPKAGKDTVVFLALAAATAGPTIFAFGLVARSIRDISESVKAGRVLGEMYLALLRQKTVASTANAAATTADTGATAANTAATTANNAAQTVNNTTTNSNNLELQLAAAARARATGATTAHTTAINANTAAARANALANSMAIPAAASSIPGSVGVGAGAAAGAGFLGGATAGAVVAQIATAAVIAVAAYGLGNLISNTVLANVNLPWKMSNKDEAQLAKNGMASGENYIKSRTDVVWENGKPRYKRPDEMTETELRAQFQQQKQESEKNLMARYAMEDAKFAAELQALKVEAARGSKKEQNIREEKLLLEAMTRRSKDLSARADELKARMGSDLGLQKEYWQAQRDADAVKEDILKIQNDAAKERENAAKEQVRKQRQHIRQQRTLMSMSLENLLLQARAEAKESGNEEDNPDIRAISEARVLVPKLKQIQELILSEMRALVNSGARDFDSQKEYLELQKEYLDLRVREEDTYKAADKAKAAMVKRAKENQRKLRDAYIESQEEELRAMADNAAESERARSALQIEMPNIREQQQRLLEDMQSGTLTETEFFKAKKEYWSYERKAQSLVRNAANEVRDEQKKAFEDMQKASQEQARIIEATLKFHQSRINNDPFADVSDELKDAILNNERLTRSQRMELMNRGNPFKNPRHRINQMINNRLEMIAQKARPVAGQSELDRINRETELQDMMGDTLRDYGQTIGSMNLRLRGGRNPFAAVVTQRRAMQNFYKRMMDAMQIGRDAGEVQVPFDPIKKARELAGDAAMGRPIIMQVTLDPSVNPDVFREQWLKVLDELDRMRYGPQPSAPSLAP